MGQKMQTILTAVDIHTVTASRTMYLTFTSKEILANSGSITRHIWKETQSKLVLIFSSQLQGGEWHFNWKDNFKDWTADHLKKLPSINLQIRVLSRNFYSYSRAVKRQEQKIHTFILEEVTKNYLVPDKLQSI